MEVGSRSRRLFLQAGAAATVGLAASSVDAFAFAQPQTDQDQREDVEAFVRGVYDAKDRLDAQTFASYFADPHDYLDAVLFGHCAALEPSQAVADRYGNGMFKRIGVPGRLCRFLHATGDLRYGVVAECANLPGGVFNAGCDLMAVMEIKDGRISRNNDYWDSRQLGAGAAAVHPNGAPRERDACAPNVVPGDTPHASREMLEFARRFHDALAAGRADRLGTTCSIEARNFAAKPPSSDS